MACTGPRLWRSMTRVRLNRPVRCTPSTSLVDSARRWVSAYGYEQAKALVYHEHGEPKDVLRLHAHSISPAHSALVTLRFLASPINPADVNTVQGVYPSKPPMTSSLSTSKPAAVPGNEGVAEVLAAGGAAVDARGQRLSRGDRVIMKAPGVGTWRTHAQVEAAGVVRLAEAEREGITPIQAATVSVNPCTAWAMLQGYVGGSSDRLGPRLREGDWFVQNGANSGVGRAAIQLGREWGLRSINTIRARPGGEAETQALKDELRQLGADVVVTEDEAASKEWAGIVQEATEGAPIALALNCVGGRSALNLAKALGPRGWMLTYGAMAKQPLSVPAGMLIFKDLRFAGFWVSRWGEACADEKAAAVAEVLRLTRAGRFADVPLVQVRWDRTTPEADLTAAVQATLDGYRGGKGVFVFGDT